MAKKRKIVGAVLIAVAVGGITWRALRPPEPLYRGRTMSSWINSSEPGGIMDNDLAMQVWQGFGSNAVPFLRKNLQASDGPIKNAYWALRRHLPNWMNRHLSSNDPPPAAIVRWRAADGLGYIGDAAAPAIPDLIRLSKTDTNGLISPGFVRGRAVAALGNIGQNLKPSDPLYRAVTEALIAALKDPDPNVSSLAASDLKQQYPEAAAKVGIK